MRWAVVALLCGAWAASSAVDVTTAAGGRIVVDTGAVHVELAPNGRLLSLGLPGAPSLLAPADGWDPGLTVSLNPPGAGAVKPTSREESAATIGEVKFARDGSVLTVRFTQGYGDELRCVKTFTFTEGRAVVRVRWEVEVLRPVQLHRLGVTLVSAADADALASPGPAGTVLAADHVPGKYFRTPAADQQPGFAEFCRERWLALLARPRGEGLGILFPNLRAWAGFHGQFNLASRMKDGGYVLEFGHPGASGADSGGPGYRDQPAGAGFALELALLPFRGEPAAAARAALAELGAPVAPRYPVTVTAFPAELAAPAFGGVPTFHLLPGSPLAPAFGFAGDRDAVRDLALVLDVPEGVKVCAATFLHPALRGALPLEAQPVRHGERAYRRYRWPVPARVIGREAPGWAGVLSPYLEPEPGFAQGDLVYHLESSAGTSAESTVRLVALPPLAKVALPKEFELQPWYEYTLSVPDPALRERLLRTLEAVGANSTSFQGSDLPLMEQLHARGWKLRLGMGWDERGPYGFSLHNYGTIDWPKRGYPDDVWVVDDAGKRQVGVFCPAYAGDGGELFVKEYRAYLNRLLTPEAKRLCRVISNDYEPGESGLASANHSCFCPRCLARFAAEAGVPAAGLTPAVILGQHGAAWTRFRMKQNAALLKLHDETVKALAPGLVNSLCSHWVPDPPGSEVWKGEAVDVRLLDPYCDEQTPMMYHGGTRFFDNLQRTRANLTKPLLVLTAAFYDAWGSGSPLFTPAEVRSNLLLIGVSGARGAGFYASFDHFDGAWLHAVQDAMADLARLQPLLGERCAPEATVEGRGADSFRALAWRRGGERLVGLFNYDGRQALTAKLTVPAGATVTDALSDGAVDASAVTVPANGYRFVRLR